MESSVANFSGIFIAILYSAGSCLIQGTGSARPIDHKSRRVRSQRTAGRVIPANRSGLLLLPLSIVPPDTPVRCIVEDNNASLITRRVCTYVA